MNIIFEKTTGSYILKLAEFTEDSKLLFQKTERDLSKEETEYFNSIKNEKRKLEWCGTRLLLKNILGTYEKIYYDTYGNPYLKNDKNISITHSGAFVGIIISKNKEVGIDTEIISERILGTAHKFIPENDLKLLNEPKEIYLHWCGKETLFKIKGNGGYDFKKDFKIKLPPDIEKSGVIEAEIIKHTKEIFVLNYQFTENKNLLTVWTG